MTGGPRLPDWFTPIGLESPTQPGDTLPADSTRECSLELSEDLARVGDDSLPTRRENDTLGPPARRVRGELEEAQLDELLNRLVRGLARDTEAPSELTRPRPATIDGGEYATVRSRNLGPPGVLEAAEHTVFEPPVRAEREVDERLRVCQGA